MTYVKFQNSIVISLSIQKVGNVTSIHLKINFISI